MTLAGHRERLGQFKIYVVERRGDWVTTFPRTEFGVGRNRAGVSPVSGLGGRPTSIDRGFGARQAEMVGPHGVGGDPDVALLGALLDQVQEALPISVGGEDGLFVIGTLGQVEPPGGAKRSRRGIFVPPSYSGFRRRKISLIFEKNARWSLKIRTTMAARH